jgi:leucyl aminopeptidase (aminopeptidase T)
VKHQFSIKLVSGQVPNMQPISKDDIGLHKFSEICEMDAPAANTVEKFVIGINHGTKIIGNMLLDEKVEGTIHFAFGDSYNIGKSNSNFHTDLLIKNPSIFADGKCVMEIGKFNLDV